MRPVARLPMPSRQPAGEGLDAVADAVHRLAVLLAAGLDPLAALRALPPGSPVLEAAAACDDPYAVPGRLIDSAGGAPPELQRAAGYLAACWMVAAEAGVPLAPALTRAAEALHALADAERQLALALAGPVATARIVALLPLAGVAMGVLIGADPLGVVVGTMPGAIAALGGVVALVLGVRWNRHLIAAARVADPLAGLGEELLALAIGGGAAPDAALARARSAAERCGIPASVGQAEATLAFAVRHGVPLRGLLRAEAERARRVALAAALQRAALLGARLLAPLALCFLPGFVLLGVVPLMIGILRGALGAF